MTSKIQWTSQYDRIIYIYKSEPWFKTANLETDVR